MHLRVTARGYKDVTEARSAEPRVKGRRGSGNIFADFGAPDAEAKQLKAKVAADIIHTLDRRGLSVRAGAKGAHVGPADIQRIRNADLSRFTIDRLVRIAYRLGRKPEMKMTNVRTGAAA